MIPTSNRREAERAWKDEPALRDTYKSRDSFMEFCESVQTDCHRLGLSKYGSSAKVSDD